MKKRWLSCLLAVTMAVAAVLVAAGCGKQNISQSFPVFSGNVLKQKVPGNVKQLSRGNFGFACDLYKQLKPDGDANLCFSPYGLSKVMAMLYNGAKGPTAKEIAQALHFKSGQTGVAKAFLASTNLLSNRQAHPNCKFENADALWGASEKDFKPDYLQLIQRYYGGNFHYADFNKPKAAAKAINKWAAEHTEGRIKTLITPEEIINYKVVLAVTSTLHFKGPWSFPFREKDTQQAPFHCASGKTVQVPLMYQEGDFLYYQGESFKALELPYGKGDFALLLLLPLKQKDLPSLEQKLDSGLLAEIESRLDLEDVKIWLPRFELKERFNLNESLQALGIRSAFSPSHADFSRMTPKGLYLSLVIQQVYFKTDERGSELAAGSVGGLAGRSPTPPEFKADHPFLFILLHRPTQAVLGMGKVGNPAAK